METADLLVSQFILPSFQQQGQLIWEKLINFSIAIVSSFSKGWDLPVNLGDTALRDSALENIDHNFDFILYSHKYIITQFLY